MASKTLLRLAAAALAISASHACLAVPVPTLPAAEAKNSTGVLIGNRPNVSVNTAEPKASSTDVLGLNFALAVASTTMAPLVETSALVSVRRDDETASAGVSAAQSFWLQIAGPAAGEVVPVKFNWTYSWETDQPTSNAQNARVLFWVGYSDDPNNQVQRIDQNLCSWTVWADPCTPRSVSQSNILQLSVNTPYLVMTSSVIGTWQTGPASTNAHASTQLSWALMADPSRTDLAIFVSPGIAAAVPEQSTFAMLCFGLVAVLGLTCRRLLG